jgi:hypothetical protein
MGLSQSDGTFNNSRALHAVVDTFYICVVRSRKCSEFIGQAKVRHASPLCGEVERWSRAFLTTGFLPDRYNLAAWAN